MPIPDEILYLAPFVILLSYTIYGATGFGSALITIPALAHVLPLTFVVPLGLLLDFSAALLSGVRFRREVNRREIYALVPFGLAGTVLGVVLLVTLPRPPALFALGAFIAGYGLYSFRNHAVRRTVGRAWAGVAGTLGGVVGALFGTGGPLFVIYLSRRLTNTKELRATLAAIFTLQTLGRLVVFGASGLLLRRDLLLSALLLFPVMLVGLRLGHRLHDRLPGRAVMRGISVLLVLSGASLLYRALAGG